MKRFDEREIEAVKAVISNGEYLSGFSVKSRGGEQVKKFEEEFAKYIGVKHAISVNSGTTALYVSFLTAFQHVKQTSNSLPENPDIHIPAYTFTADPSAAILAGGKVVFEDIDEKTYCMLIPQGHTFICVPTYILGNAPTKISFGDTDFSIEDCAQALGTKVGGQNVGRFGDMSVFSFQETKHITTLGEGGMICSNDESLIKIAADIRNHAEYYSYENYLGGNFRMTEAQAAFGRIQLSKLNSFLTEFRKNAQYLMKRLPDGISPPYIDKNVEHSFLMVGALYDEKIIGTTRENFLDKLTENRRHILGDEKSDIKGNNMKSGRLINSGYKALYEVPMYKKYALNRHYPNTEQVTKKIIWMDIHKFKEQSEIDEEIDILHSTVKQFMK